MTNDHFRDQLRRLRVRFGEKAFDAEFIQLVWREVHDMSEHAFTRYCDVLIGSRTANKPPLLSDFREARMKEQKFQLERDSAGAMQTLRRGPAEMREHMAKVLRPAFGGVTSLTDAFEIARLKQRAAKADSGPDGGGEAG